MAERSATLNLIVKLKDMASAPFRTVSDSSMGLDRSLYFLSADLLATSYRIEALIDPLARLNSAIWKTTGAVAGLGAGFALFASKEAAEFERAIANIGTLLEGTTDKAIPGLSKQIRELSTDTPLVAKDLADSFYFIQSATQAGAEGMDILNASAKGAVIGLTDSLTVGDALTTLMNAFGAETEEADRYLSAMFGTVVEGKVTMETLSQNIGTIASVAKLSGINVEQLGAAYAVLTKVTGQTSRSATGLRAAIRGIIKPSVGAKLAFQKYGIALTDTNGKAKDFISVLGDVAKKQLDLNQLAELFPRVRALTAVGVLTSRWDLYEQALGTVNNAHKLVAQEFEDMMNIFENKIKVILNISADLVRIFGIEFNKEVLGLVDSFSRLIEVIRNWAGEGEIAGKVVGEIFGDITQNLEIFFDLLSTHWDEIVGGLDFSELKESFEELKGSIGGIFNVDLTTVSGITGAIQLLIDSLEFLIDMANSSAKTMDAGFIQPLKSLYGILSDIPSAGDLAAKSLGTLAGTAVPLSFAFKALNPLIQTMALTLNVLYLRAILLGRGLSLAAMGVFAFKAGIVVLSSYLIYRASQALGDYIYGIDKLNDSIKQINIETSKIDKKNLEKLAKLGFSSMEEFNKAVKENKVYFDEATGSWIKADSTIDNYTNTLHNATINQSKFEDVLASSSKTMSEELLVSLNELNKNLDDYEKNIKILRKALKSDLFSGLIDKKKIKDSLDYFVQQYKALGKTTADLNILSLTEDISDIRSLEKKFSVIGEAIQLGLAKSFKDTNILSQAISDDLIKAGLSKSLTEFSGLAARLNIAEPIKKDFQELGEIIHAGLITEPKKAVDIFKQLRENLLLSGVSNEFANVTANVNLLSGVMNQSNKSAAEFTKIKEYLREGLLSPTTEVINRLRELRGEIVGNSKAANEFNNVMAGVNKMREYENSIKTLKDNFGSMGQEARNTAGDLIYYYADALAKLRNESDDYSRSFVDLYDVLKEFGVDTSKIIGGRGFTKEIEQSAEKYRDATNNMLKDNNSSRESLETLMGKHEEFIKILETPRSLTINTAPAISMINSFKFELDTIPREIVTKVRVEREFSDV